MDGENGDDSLFGESGRDDFQGGEGNDFIYAVDGVPENVNCGPGANDTASVDEIDQTVGCENV